MGKNMSALSICSLSDSFVTFANQISYNQSKRLYIQISHVIHIVCSEIRVIYQPNTIRIYIYSYNIYIYIYIYICICICICICIYKRVSFGLQNTKE